MVKKILNWTLRIILGFILLFFMIEMIIYFLAPVYSFEPSSPFAGNQWFNPYQGLDSTDWRRCNFHFHTKRWAGITSGEGTEQDCYDTYKKLGYDVPCLSHYQYITKFNQDSAYYIPVYEHGFGARKKHQILIGAEKVLWFDYSFFQNKHHKQHIINLLRDRSEIVALAHPDWESGYSLNDMAYLSNYDLVEVLDNNWRSFGQWDAALSAGRPVYILGDDDGHNIHNPYEVGRRCTYVHADTINRSTIIRSLKNGQAFGADIKMSEGETFEQKAEKAKKIPKFHFARIDHDTLKVAMGETPMKVVFIGQGGKPRKVVYLQDTAWYHLQPDDTYIRTEIVFLTSWKGAGTVFYLNPVFRYDGIVPVNHLTASIHVERTWIFRFLTFGPLIFLIYLMIKYRKIIAHLKKTTR